VLLQPICWFNKDPTSKGNGTGRIGREGKKGREERGGEGMGEERVRPLRQIPGSAPDRDRVGYVLYA